MQSDKKIKKFTPYHIITFSFFSLIFVGTILLSTPFVTTSGKSTNFLDVLFTATSAVCVTGLTTLNTLEHWNFWGKLIILVLIQIGSLGFISLSTIIMTWFGKIITLKNRILIKESFNLSNFKGVVRFLRKIIWGTFIIEGIGAIILSFRFVPKFGLLKGIFNSVFHSVSAFCNAGFDILGNNSLAEYSTDYLVNFTLMFLIITGGLGFSVWIDFINLLNDIINKKVSLKCAFNRLSLHSKLVLSISSILILLGWFLTFILEFNNPNSIGNMRLDQKLLVSLFQSVTLRTAGFYTIAQNNLQYGSKFLAIILMAIGGSPGGTAGGIKTVTISILFLAVISVIKGRDNITAFKKTINYRYIQKALSIVLMIMGCIFTSTMLLTISELNSNYNYEFIDLLFETTSALATVGLSTGITTYLSYIGKIVIIMCMFIGRLGPITVALSLSFRKKSNKSVINYPENKILVG